MQDKLDKSKRDGRRDCTAIVSNVAVLRSKTVFLMTKWIRMQSVPSQYDVN